MIDEHHPQLSRSKQCDLLSIHRSGLYYQPVQESEQNLLLMRKLDEQYLLTPYYGVRRMTIWLQQQGFEVNRKRVGRLMRLMGLQAIYPKGNLCKPDPAAKKYPYLLKGLTINRVHQVWATDITYIPLQKGFMYLVAIIDLYTRKILSWALSNTLEVNFEYCKRRWTSMASLIFSIPTKAATGPPARFTSNEFTALLEQNNIRISRDGKGRALDNIFIERFWRSLKYEHVYLNPASDGLNLYEGIHNYIQHYNYHRPHQSLNYKTPFEVFQQGLGRSAA
jgi:putative transposase